MSIKINLLFREFPDLELLEQGIYIKGLRLYCGIRFKTSDDITDMIDGIVDTGSPVSVVPEKICIVKKLGKTIIGGIVPYPQCKLSVYIAELNTILTDGRYSTTFIKFKAYLTDTDNVPLILGFSGLLDKFQLVINYNKRLSYLER